MEIECLLSCKGMPPLWNCPRTTPLWSSNSAEQSTEDRTLRPRAPWRLSTTPLPLETKGLKRLPLPDELSNLRPRRQTTSRAEGTPEREKSLLPVEIESAITPDPDKSPESN